MKKAAFFIGLIGALGALILGFKWMSDWNTDLAVISQMLGNQGIEDKFTIEFEQIKTTAYLLIFCGITGMVFSALVLAPRLKSGIIAVILIMAGVLPLVSSWKALFGIPMVIAGILVFFSGTINSKYTG